MLLNELLTIIGADNLLENFGALKAIDKKFELAFKNIETKKVPANTEYGSRNVDNFTTLHGLGANSKIEMVPYKTGAAFNNELEKETTVGIAISVGENQLVIIMKTPMPKKGLSYNVGIDYPAIAATFPSPQPEEGSPSVDDIVNQIQLIFGVTEKGRKSSRFDPKGTQTKRIPAKIVSDVEIKREMIPAAVAKLTAVLFKFIKANKLTAQLHVIQQDAKRKKTNFDRANARYQSVPMTAEDRQKFEKEAINDLRRRLDVFKSSKAIGVDRVEELVTAIREHGYLDKLKIAGYAYDLKNSNIRMSELKNPTRHDYSYIEYEMNRDTPEAEAYIAQISKIYAETRGEGQEEERERRVAEFKASAPSKTIRIELTLDKGAIVPHQIKEQNNYY